MGDLTASIVGGDSQHALMSAAMLDAKRARMRVENDRDALANRIARLQAEELRATKRIEQTHRRTQEILAAKTRHHQQHREKERAKAQQEQLIDNHKEELSRVREERRSALQAAKEQAAMQKQSFARLNKEVAIRNADAIAHSRAAELNSAMYKRNEVRKMEAEARERKLREKELNVAHLQQRAEERHKDETAIASEYDKKLSDLEQEEYELLVALEGHRRERQEVYQQLEAQIGTRAKAVTERGAGAADRVGASLQQSEIR